MKKIVLIACVSKKGDKKSKGNRPIQKRTFYEFSQAK